MSDFFLKLSASPSARKIVRALKLPIPLPQPLDRVKGPWEAQPLAGRAVFLAASPGGQLGETLGRTLSDAGAKVSARGEVDPPAGVRPFALVYDGTGLDAPEALRDVYDFFRAHVRNITPCGRALAIMRPPETAGDPVCRAARRAVEGAMRSLGKEIGRKGATAQTVYVEAGAENRLESVVRFLLGKGAAYISGQPIHVSALVPYTPVRKYVAPLAGRVALVTGAARGIGAATARALAREGATVIVMDRASEREAAKGVADAIGGETLACDITEANAANTILDYVREGHGGLDILVHNAGITRDKTLGNMAPEKWDQVLAVNLIALVRTNEALLDHVRDGGRILAMSSVGGIAGNAGQTNYAATKAGLIGYVQGLAPRTASRGITVNALAPGFIETQMTAAMPFGTREVARRLCSLSQGGLPEDIAETIVFLASPDAAGVTGGVVRVCGGNFIGA
ncbi:MAG TPA: 3-oxoacyl-ACP reductase [Candidatus Hydrogenedentes bacterium]|nr:3-oxoacyl-ACP reductase [Candidatus Hydrogenedentota bacterium]HPG66734.1 3-oxoacyl-ACP reductase [Candidatus Hydrogenedentota bacterium]